jgi:hypothetical protein
LERYRASNCNIYDKRSPYPWVQLPIAAGQRPDPVSRLGAANVPIESAERYRLDRDFMTMTNVAVMQERPSQAKREARHAKSMREAEVAAEFGVVMLIYLKHAWEERRTRGETGLAHLLDAIREGAVLRVRPKAMTVAVIIGGLIPIMWGGGTGAEVMQRIAAPMVGGMITAPLLSMLVLPAAYLLLRRSRK